MSTKLIESLPDELWLLFMNYLTSIDLFRSLLDLNHRINCLLFAMPSRLVLDTSQSGGSGIRFADMRQLMEGKDDWSKCLLSSIETIRLSGTLASDAFYNHYQSLVQFSSCNTSCSNLFPSLRRLYVSEKAVHRVTILELLLQLSKSLHYVHITFPSSSTNWSYFKMLHMLSVHQLSFYSMAFDVKNGKYSQSVDQIVRIPEINGIKESLNTIS